MTAPPKVLRIRKQPTTHHAAPSSGRAGGGSGASASLASPSARHAYQPWTAQQQLNFVGALKNPSTGQVATYEFTVLAGATRPTITAGFPKVQIIDRARRLGYTMVTGYDPISLDVPIQFEAMVNNPIGKYTGQAVEQDIQKLEWMAGRGKDFATSRPKVGQAAVGTPPIVTVASFDGGGRETALIPPNVHGLQWLISNISYDTAAISDRQGNRVRQAATVTLTQYVPLPSATTSRSKTPDGFKTYRTGENGNGDTVKSVVEKHTNRSDAATLRAVLKFCRSKNKRFPTTSATKKLKKNTAIYIPDSLLPH